MIFVLLISAGSIAQHGVAFDVIATSPRSLPVAYDVDVLVLGGSTGAVAAAREASAAGAKTMLISALPYLGEDMTATLRLWHEPASSDDSGTNETKDPLFESLMNDPIYASIEETNIERLIRHPNKLPFTYELLEEINANHPETPEKNRLNDGIAASPRTDSLQVDGNASIILDLGKRQDVGIVSLIAFFRDNHFAVDQVELFASDDKIEWNPIGIVKRPARRPAADQPESLTLSLQRSILMRYIKIKATKEETSRILLLGEIVVLAHRSDLDITLPIIVKEQPKADSPPRPLHVKQTLDGVLLESNVGFLFGTHITGLLRDSKGEIRGAVITSRAGRQAITARKVIDARRDYRQILDTYHTADRVKIEYVVIGRQAVPFEKERFRLLQNGSSEVMGTPYREFRGNAETLLFRYVFEVERAVAERAFGGDLKVFGDLATEVKLATYHPEQRFAADQLTLLCGEKVVADLALGNRFGQEAIRHGLHLGRETAKAALASEKVSLASLRVEVAGAAPKEGNRIAGDVRELLEGIRPYEKPLGVMEEHRLNIPVVASYDVVVVGGGTTGAPAAIGAARAGARTLVVESLHDLGGIGTLGSISGYYWSKIVGFSEEISNGQNRSWNPIHKADLWRTKLREAGGDAWFGLLGAGAVVDVAPDVHGRTALKGVLLATEFGPKIVLATMVIDTTGNGDIAMCAGAEMSFVTDGEITVQGAGLTPMFFSGRGTNNDFTFIDDTDPIDATHVFVYAKGNFPTAFDQAKILNTRERRRVVGEFAFSVLDQINLRTYPDSIATAYSNLDSHGYTIEPYLEIVHPDKVGIPTYYPYRSSIPKGLDRILVGALATSSHRDALPLTRMQADLQNQGYALGYIAATIIKDKTTVRDVDIRKVQKHLVEIGNLPESVLEETDNYEASKAGLAEAVRTVGDDFKELSLVMWHPEEALPLLRKAYSEAVGFEPKFAYAKVLAAYHDATGEATLLEALYRVREWDTGWNFKGMSQFGFASSPVDQMIMMLGRIRSKEAVPKMIKLMSELEQEDDFSHHRACALALEWIGDPSAAPALAAHLRKRNMMGHSHDSIETAARRAQESPKISMGEKSRRDSLIELGMARALYRLGDVDGLGRQILEAYSKDLRGFFARHATESLAPTDR